ncbi:MAG: tyrosine-protein phosphatase [Phycisphaerales bacterium]
MGDDPTPSAAGEYPKGWSWPRFTRNALVIAGVIALGVWAWTSNIAPDLHPKNFGVVDEGAVYRAGRLTPEAIREIVQTRGVRTIVDLGAHESGSRGERREERTAEALDVTLHHYPLFGDGQGDPNQYVRALRVMTDPEAQPVLVHCAAGSERTGVAVALYRIIVENATLESAMDEAREYHHDPLKNPHLREMVETWREPIAQALHDGGTIPYEGPTPESARASNEPRP